MVKVPVGMGVRVNVGVSVEGGVGATSKYVNKSTPENSEALLFFYSREQSEKIVHQSIDNYGTSQPIGRESPVISVISKA